MPTSNKVLLGTALFQAHTVGTGLTSLYGTSEHDSNPTKECGLRKWALSSARLRKQHTWVMVNC